MIVGYASRTGTRRNLDALRDAGWRLIVSCMGVQRHEGFAYGVDNPAWPLHQRGETPTDAVLLTAFVPTLERFGPDADWVVVPDIVMGGPASLVLSTAWLPRVLDHTQIGLIAVQDGMMPEDIAHLLGPRVGIFVGGSTEWKEATLPMWGGLARAAGCYLHVGRVNSARRIALCALAGARSFDGTSATRFAKTLSLLDSARRQLALPMLRLAA